MQIAGDDPQRQMRNLSRQFNHGGTGVQHNGIASLDKRRRRPGDGVLFLWATLRFFQRRRLRGNKSVERHAPVGTANDPFLIEFNQIATDGRRRGVSYRNQLVDRYQIMAFQEVHNLL